jgi:DNA-directed RNA polymerase subunit M/transcription elongation factor TFIIS
MRAGERRRPVTTRPVAEMTVSVRRPGMGGRLQLLGLPEQVIDLILTTTYKNKDGTILPLFGLGIDKDSGEQLYRHQEIIDIVNVYEAMKIKPGTDKELRIDTEVFTEFDRYIKSLAENHSKKAAAEILVTDDTIFESPQLREMREQELLKDTLLNRKKVPIKGVVCKKCGADEAFQTEKYLRSGDEGAVWINECAKCGNKWNA